MKRRWKIHSLDAQIHSFGHPDHLNAEQHVVADLGCLAIAHLPAIYLKSRVLLNSDERLIIFCSTLPPDFFTRIYFHRELLRFIISRNLASSSISFLIKQTHNVLAHKLQNLLGSIERFVATPTANHESQSSVLSAYKLFKLERKRALHLPVTPPDTGASKYRLFFSAQSFEISMDTFWSMVEESMHSVFACIVLKWTFWQKAYVAIWWKQSILEFVLLLTTKVVRRLHSDSAYKIVYTRYSSAIYFFLAKNEKS